VERSSERKRRLWDFRVGWDATEGHDSGHGRFRGEWELFIAPFGDFRVEFGFDREVGWGKGNDRFLLANDGTVEVGKVVHWKDRL